MAMARMMGGIKMSCDDTVNGKEKKGEHTAHTAHTQKIKGVKQQYQRAT